MNTLCSRVLKIATVTFGIFGTIVTSSVASAATNFPSLLSNTATVSLPMGWTDPTPANNTSQADLNFAPQVDLQVTKTDGVTIYTPGTSGTYTIVVSNNGTTSAENVSVTDNLPAGLTVKSVVSCVATGTSDCGTLSTAGQPGDTSFVLTGARVQAGGTDTLTITLEVDYASDLSGTIVNSVSVQDLESDPSGANIVVATDDANAFTPVADLQMNKAVVGGATDYAPGGTASYILRVDNLGPSDVIGAIINDNLPAGVTLSGAWSCVSDASSTCSAASGGSAGDAVVNLTADIVNGGFVEVTIPVAFSPDVANY